MMRVLTNYKFIKIYTINLSFNQVDSLFTYVVTSQFYRANIIFTAENIARLGMIFAR